MIVNICCAGSSGSTFLANLLDRHPDIACGDELFLFSKPIFYDDFHRLQRLSFLIQRFGISSNPHHHDRTILCNLSSYGLEKKQVWQWLKASDDFTGFVEKLKKHILLGMTKKKIWAEKTPPNIKLLSKFLNFFPDAKVIHIVRDPRDVVLSLMGRGHSLEIAAEVWLTAVASIQPFRVLQNVLEIRYEDMVEHHEQTLNKICDFLDIDFDPAFFLSKRYESRELQKFAGHSSWNADPREGLSVKSVGRYKQSNMDIKKIYSLKLTDKYASLLNVRPYSIYELMTLYAYPIEESDVGECENRVARKKPRRSFKRRLLDFLIESEEFVEKTVI